jgi:hypothetical protein
MLSLELLHILLPRQVKHNVYSLSSHTKSFFHFYWTEFCLYYLVGDGVCNCVANADDSKK